MNLIKKFIDKIMGVFHMDDKEYNLQLYKSKNGKYKWRFIVDGDIKCIGTDWSDTIEEAFKDAKEILENIWSLGDLEK
jgi:hypothetical protein